jgi:hypothetical protein
MDERTDPDVRCPTCGAAVYEGAEWCNLCFTPIGPRPERSDARQAPDPGVTGDAPERGGTAVDDRPAAPAFWPCPVCETKNPLALDACSTCGTPFAMVMRQEQERPQVEPSVAFGRSLLFPGLGHARLGLTAEGIARGALFTILLGVTLLVSLAGATSGVIKLLLATFGAGTLGVYLLTAVEARRIAEGGRPVASTRTLLWVTVGVLMGSIALIVFVVGTTPTG